ncbi:MAG: nucleotidyltransferase family protein [Nitrospirae bacterium]|nr:nucleotidyltransferase family protein [Nitrospirota bacterium]
MGQLKQLLPLGSLTAIEHGINSILSGGVSDVVVVIGPDCVGVSSAIAHLSVTIVENPDSGSDMAASVRVGLNSLKDRLSSVLVLPVDHPLVLPDTIKALLAGHQNNPKAIIIPSHNRRRGHPTLFPREIIQEIFESSSLREVVSRHEALIDFLEVEDCGVVLDMDTPEQYALILQEYTRRKENV